MATYSGYWRFQFVRCHREKLVLQAVSLFKLLICSRKLISTFVCLLFSYQSPHARRFTLPGDNGNHKARNDEGEYLHYTFPGGKAKHQDRRHRKIIESNCTQQDGEQRR